MACGDLAAYNYCGEAVGGRSTYPCVIRDFQIGRDAISMFCKAMRMSKMRFALARSRRVPAGRVAQLPHSARSQRV